ncbi:uncharacterized protein LOC117326756 [Pecten maximus]|uniref:uncharacterized protein LOC117326756 n=1 Tax=Pecten maximus TaxID=6579 RepID=UPI001458D9AC|nr:uncharacterized protein LOC117326756 [Pecten maximus]
MISNCAKMDQDDELFSSILSLCEAEDRPSDEASDEESNEAVVGGSRISKETSISLSPIKHATPLKISDALKNKNKSFTDKFTPKGKSGLDLFKSMLLQHRNTSTPLMDRWSLHKSGQSREGKRRHDVDMISSNLETISEQDSSSDDEKTLRCDEDADKTYDDLLQDLSVLCEKELTERWEKVKVEPPENKIKAEHQISRINLDSILLETSSVAGANRKHHTTKEAEATSSAQAEPGRFTGVNTTTQSSVLATEDNDSFEEADDILGLDDFLGSDEEDNDYDSLLEESIFQDDDTTVVHGSVSTILSSTTHASSTVHRTDSVQKIPTYKSMISTTATSCTDSICESSVYTSSFIAIKIRLNLFLLMIVIKVLVPFPKQSESILTSTVNTDNTLLLPISASENTSIYTSVSAFEKSSQLMLKTISIYENSSNSTCPTVKALDTYCEELSKDENGSRDQTMKEEQEVVPESDRLSQEDEFTLDLTKDSDEMDEFLQMEGFQVIDDLKDVQKRKNESQVTEKQKHLVSKCSATGGTETGNTMEPDCVILENKIQGISPEVQKKGRAQEIPKGKDSCRPDTTNSNDVLAEEKVKSGSDLSLTAVKSIVNKVVAWQASCSEHHHNDEKQINQGSHVSGQQSVPHPNTPQDRKSLPQVHVHPFKFQSDIESSPVPSGKTQTPHKTSSTGKTCKINVTETPGVSSLSSSTNKTKPAGTVVENNNVDNVVDKNMNIVTPALYHDYEAERRFIQGENSLMKQVMHKWGSLGIQTPDTNLSFSNRLKKTNPNHQSRLEGQKISTLWLGSTDKCHSKEAKRFRSDIHSQLNNINNLKQQLQDINRRVREEIDQTIYDFGEKQNSLDHVFVQRKHALNAQQQLELCQTRRHINPHMLQCQLLQLRCEHQHQRDQLTYIFNTEMNQLKNDHQEHIHMIRSRFEQRAHQLKSFIEQLANVESTQTDPQFGPHVVTHLVKGPCRSNNNKSSMVTVCLPADIATAIIKEDEIYDIYYVHPKR